MTYAIITMHDQNYAELAEVTCFNNKVPYCKLHGYNLFAKTDGFSPGRRIYFDKIRFNLAVLEDHPEVEWTWWLDCDAVITNFKTTIEEWCDPDYHFVIGLDRYNLNNGSYFLRNSEPAKQFFRHILSLEEQYLNSEWPEQQPMIDLVDEYQDIMKFHPQRDFNSFDYDYYRQDHGNTHDWDLFGQNGNWQPGDFVCHYPGIRYEEKIRLATNILNKVIK
jgi:hypothetical protein